MVVNTSDNRYGVAQFIVAPTLAEGANYTTIAAAISDASSGQTIFIRPGTYTENLTLKAGVNLTAFGSDSSSNATGDVIISGNATMSTAGSVTISGIQLQTNSAAFLTVSGSAASIVNLNNCYLNCTNATGISFTAANASSAINITGCTGNLGTTGIAIFTSTSTGIITCFNCFFTNSGNSTTANSVSAALMNIQDCLFSNPMTTSSTGALAFSNSLVQTFALNVIGINANGTGGNNLVHSFISTGSASAITVGTGATISIGMSQLLSSNTNTVTGAGVAQYNAVAQGTSPGQINAGTNTGLELDVGPISFDHGTNTMTAYAVGTFTPTMVGQTTAGTTTYTTQAGFYTRIGNLVQVQFTVAGSAATGTGLALFSGLPFTIKNQANGSPVGSILVNTAAGWTFPVGATYLTVIGAINTINANIYGSGSAVAGNFMNIANAAFNFQVNMMYQI